MILCYNSVMKKIELAYLAGVMDSDGSFSIAIDTWRQRKFGQCPAYQEIVAIGQCDKQSMELLQELFGGTIRCQKSSGPNRRPVYYWQASNKVAIIVVRALLPYLRIKRRQAETLLALRKIKDRGRYANTKPSNIPHGRTLKPEVQAEMDKLARQIRSLNDTRFPFALDE